MGWRKAGEPMGGGSPPAPPKAELGGVRWGGTRGAPPHPTRPSAPLWAQGEPAPWLRNGGPRDAGGARGRARARDLGPAHPRRCGSHVARDPVPQRAAGPGDGCRPPLRPPLLPPPSSSLPPFPPSPPFLRPPLLRPPFPCSPPPSTPLPRGAPRPPGAGEQPRRSPGFGFGVTHWHRCPRQPPRGGFQRGAGPRALIGRGAGLGARHSPPGQEQSGGAEMPPPQIRGHRALASRAGEAGEGTGAAAARAGPSGAGAGGSAPRPGESFGAGARGAEGRRGEPSAP